MGGIETGNSIKRIELENLGHDAFFEENLKKLGLSGHVVARVIAEYKGSYRVRSVSGEYMAKITGKQIFNASSREDYPAVGDWVTITELDGKQAIIHMVLPRKNALRKRDSRTQESRIIAANIDVAFIVESVDRDYSLNRFERYFVLAKNENIKPSIILNKIDLISGPELDLKVGQLKDRFKDADIISTSVITERGLDELMGYVKKGNTYCFLGSSGVGKSSLINKLLGRNAIKTCEINPFTERGKHTTTNREMHFLENGGILIDNPGMREVGMAASMVGIDSIFSEITELSKNCKYGNCTHLHEPGCAVLNAVKSKELDEEKYLNYIKLKKESDYHSMTDFEKRKKNKRFGKFVKNASKQLKDQEN